MMNLNMTDLNMFLAFYKRADINLKPADDNTSNNIVCRRTSFRIMQK